MLLAQDLPLERDMFNKKVILAWFSYTAIVPVKTSSLVLSIPDCDESQYYHGSRVFDDVSLTRRK